VVVEAGTYDIQTTMDGAEVWLRAAAISSDPTLTIAVEPLKVQELKACTIEV
jgi:hypothetical protein